MTGQFLPSHVQPFWNLYKAASTTKLYLNMYINKTGEKKRKKYIAAKYVRDYVDFFTGPIQFGAISLSHMEVGGI